MRASTLFVLLALSTLLVPLTSYAQWDKMPAITVAAPAQAPRVQLTVAAVEFWNRQFAELGTPFRLGAVTQTAATVPPWYLERLSAAVLKRESRPEVPARVKQLPGDIILAMSDGDFISFTARFQMAEQHRVLIGIRTHRGSPLSLPNVARNLIAHELGHALGQGHNDDRTTLMCGRPATCRPDAFQSAVERFFPITESEKTLLRTFYPSTWTPVR